MKNVIFDLDGTLADCKHRRHHVEGKKKDWPAFFGACDKDDVIEPVANLLRYYRGNPDYQVWILSGRLGKPDTRIKTIKWLIENDLAPTSNWVCDVAEFFHMREGEDFRSDVEVKREMATRLGLTPDNTEVVFDDRDCVVNAWREMGFQCFQVAEGNF